MSDKIDFTLQVMTAEERAALRAAHPEAESDAEALVRRILERSGMTKRIRAVMPNADLLAAINAIYVIHPDNKTGLSQLTREMIKHFNIITAVDNINFLVDLTSDPVVAEAMHWTLREWPGRFDAEVHRARRWLAGEEEPPTATQAETTSKQVVQEK